MSEVRGTQAHLIFNSPVSRRNLLCVYVSAHMCIHIRVPSLQLGRTPESHVPMYVFIVTQMCSLNMSFLLIKKLSCSLMSQGPKKYLEFSRL